MDTRSENISYVNTEYAPSILLESHHDAEPPGHSIHQSRGRASRPFRLLAAVVAAIVAFGSAAPPTRAQSSSSSMSFFGERDFRPALSRSNLDVFVRVLRLADDEVRAMNDLYDGYAETITREGAAVREALLESMEEAEAYVDPAKLTELGAYAKMDEWRKRVDELKLAFVDDLKALLTKEQEQRWPIVERELRRMKLVGGRLSGESLDLVEMLSDLKVSPVPPDADLLMESYSQDLDRLLVQRKAFIEENNDKFQGFVKSDPLAAESLFRDATRIRVMIRDLNLRTAARLQESLPKEPAERLRQSVMDRLIEPFSHTKSRSEALIKAALELESLTPEQRLQIEDLSTTLANRSAGWTDRMIRAVREHEESELPRDLSIALGKEKKSENSDHDWALPPDHPLVKMRQERFEFERETRRKLRSLLTVEQIDALPPGREMYTLYVSNRPWGL